MNLNKYKYIIWDWNGTLLNDVDYCVGCMNQLLSERKMPQLTKERYQEIFTFPVQDYYQKLGFDFQKESFSIVGHAFMDLYFKDLHTCELHPEAKQVLSYFKEKSLQQFILSAMEHHSLIELIDKMNIAHYFSGVYGIDNHLAAGKIDRARNMIEEHGIDVSQALLIGDTIHDKEVADELGCDMVFIAIGHQSKNKLQKESNEVLNSLNALINC